MCREKLGDGRRFVWTRQVHCRRRHASVIRLGRRQGDHSTASVNAGLHPGFNLLQDVTGRSPRDHDGWREHSSLDHPPECGPGNAKHAQDLFRPYESHDAPPKASDSKATATQNAWEFRCHEPLRVPGDPASAVGARHRGRLGDETSDCVGRLVRATFQPRTAGRGAGSGWRGSRRPDAPASVPLAVEVPGYRLTQRAAHSYELTEAADRIGA